MPASRFWHHSNSLRHYLGKLGKGLEDLVHFDYLIMNILKWLNLHVSCMNDLPSSHRKHRCMHRLQALLLISTILFCGLVSISRISPCIRQTPNTVIPLWNSRVTLRVVSTKDTSGAVQCSTYATAHISPPFGQLLQRNTSQLLFCGWFSYHPDLFCFSNCSTSELAWFGKYWYRCLDYRELSDSPSVIAWCSDTKQNFSLLSDPRLHTYYWL